MQFRHILIALIVPLTWGFGFTFAKAGLGHFPPLLLMGMRFVLAAIMLAWFVPLPRGHFRTLCWISFIAATLQYGLTFSGLALMAATPAVLLVQSEVIFGVIIAAMLLGERPLAKQHGGDDHTKNYLALHQQNGWRCRHQRQAGKSKPIL